MDLTILRAEVRERLGELSADFFADAEVDRAINDGQRRFNAEERWPWLVTEGSGTLATDAEDYVLPDNVQVNRMFNLTVFTAGGANPPPLERVDPNAGFRMRQSARNRNGRPVVYYLTKVQTDVSPTVQARYTVRVVPKADQEYSVEFQYYRMSPVLADAADQPDMPDEYHDAVAAWATGKLFQKELAISSKANEQFGLYQQVLEQARNDVGTLTTDEIVAWGRDRPGETGRMSEGDYVRFRTGM
jgi:hypothetical protein